MSNYAVDLITPIKITMRLTLLTTMLCAALVAAAQDPQVQMVPFASGLAQPLDLTHANDGTGRLFVNTKPGKIEILNASGSSIGTFLNLSGSISTNSERGLLGLAFPPNYATSGRFYVNYTAPNGDTRISRFSVSSTNPNVAVASSEEILLTIPQPFSNHNGGDMAFGGDGLLYVASGDGGSGNDPQGNSQNPNNLLGGILRLNVDQPTGYTPAGNGPAGWNPHLFAIGLRNPWRMSFDSQTGLLYIGDVGQGAREEVDVAVPSATGQNFGWVCFEGTRDNRGVPSAAGCGNISNYLLPFFEYDHSQGQSITGGVVYRGSQYPAMQGFYIFADYSTDKLWAIRDNGSGPLEVYTSTSSLGNIVGFGEDAAGELYAVSIFGTISQVTSAAAPLPVELLSLSAKRTVAGHANVSWTTASEINVDRYEVEITTSDVAKGLSDKDFESVGTVAAKGEAAYAATVQVPLAEQVYVRLKSVDTDGAVAYSKLVSLAAADDSDRQLVVATLPNRSGFSLMGVGDEHGMCEVYTSSGTLIYSGPATTPVDAMDWPKGMYIVTVKDGGEVQSISWMK